MLDKQKKKTAFKKKDVAFKKKKCLGQVIFKGQVLGLYDILSVSLSMFTFYC